MGKHKVGGVSALWDANDVMLFCELCIKEIELGNRTTHFNKDVRNNITNTFQQRTGKIYDQSQMKNKWDQLKKEWKLWRELKRGETGLDWNASRKTIGASDEWWDERLKFVPPAKKFRYAGISPELEEKMDMMFSHVVATGENAWAPNSRDHESSDPPGESDGENDQEKPRKGKSKGKHKIRGKTKHAKSSTLDDLAESSRVIGRCMMEPQKIQISSSLFTIPEAITELEKYPEIMGDFEFYYYATMFLREKKNRETFMSIPERFKVQWLTSCYKNSST